MPTYDELANRSRLLIDRYKELISTFDHLETFADANQWDADASALIEIFRDANGDFLTFKKSENQSLEELTAERNAKPFFPRLFASKSAEDSHKEKIKEMDTVVSKVETLIDNLDGLIDRTPNSKAEQKEMLSELKSLKKELTLEKREINEAIRQINAEARKSIASVTRLRGGLVGNYARYQRIGARYQKEASLKPNEDSKAVINGQLIQVEKDILWVSKFKGDEPSATTSALRCAYCGRRVTDGDSCKGCGSVQAILSPG
jgi:hypothetical protein